MRLRTGLHIAAGIAALAVLAAACGGSSTPQTEAPRPGTTAGGGGTEATTTQAVAAVGVLPEGPSALDDMNHPEFPEPLVDPGAIVSGGPPPDGIPSIDDPVFLSVTDNLALLPADEPVVAVEIDGDARAYPVRIMIWHEIVNDTVGGVPVTVTYCPLCNSAVGYVREINGVETTFGTSGRLFASALVMYDRATESLWTHYDGTAVVGVLAGTELEVVPAPLMSWDTFRSTYPDGRVLDETRTGHSRSYGSNPYTGYDDPDGTPFLFRGEVDARAAAMQRVVGIDTGEASVAVALDALTGAGSTATSLAVGDSELVVFWSPGQSAALEAETVDGGRDVGTVGVFRPFADEMALTFEADGGEIRDRETGSMWTVAGVAVAGPLTGEALERVAHLDTFWFAWSTYKPGTELISGQG